MTTYRIGFVIEYTLGHVTFAHSLQKAVSSAPEIEAEWFFVEPGVDLFPANMAPLRSNYTLRVSAGARRMLGTARSRGHGGADGKGFDALFLHTQTLALFCGGVMSRVPTVVSTDATPRNIDELGAGYNHAASHPAVEAVKQRLTGAVLRRAYRVMTWSAWAEHSAVYDYGVAPEKCRVVRPGVDTRLWAPGPPKRPGGPVRLLFVGGDFGRKGGPGLLSALEALGPSADGIELDIVTKDDPPASDRVRVHRGLQPGDEQLRELFRQADIFVLPTLGDTVGLAIVEAMAAGLPVIATDVGAISEVVQDGETGVLVPPGDTAALSSALARLAGDPALRASMAAKARQRACDDFDLAKNGAETLALLVEAARSRSRTGGHPGGSDTGPGGGTGAGAGGKYPPARAAR